MSDLHHGGPAFPSMKQDRVGSISVTEVLHEGMTLRDYFAGQALAGLLGEGNTTSLKAARWAYEYADAMLKARNQEPS